MPTVTSRTIRANYFRSSEVKNCTANNKTHQLLWVPYSETMKEADLNISMGCLARMLSISPAVRGTLSLSFLAMRGFQKLEVPLWESVEQYIVPLK